MRGSRLSSHRPNAWIAAGLATGLAAGLTPVASPDVVVLTATRDNSVYNNGNSNGLGDGIFSGRTGPFGGEIVQRGLLRFNVADGVPAGATVLSASVELSLVMTSAIGGQSIHTLHRLSSDWGEGTSSAPGGSGAPPTTDDATWVNTFYPDQLWTSSGGDYAATASSSQIVGPTLGRYTWGSTPEMIADVQSMLDDPASDFGWALIGDEVTQHSSKKFGSRNGGDSSFYPTLTIEFAACPWDCADGDGDGDGIVGINDFLAVLAQWGMVGSSCDLDLGTPGVGIDEFLAMLANWGPCP